MDGQQVTVENTHVLHAHAVHPQQIVSAWMEESRIDVAGLFNVLLGEDRRAGRHSTNDRQGGVIGLGFEARDANSAGCARGHFDRALAGQCLEMFFRRVGRFETQFLSDFRTGRRVAVVFQAAFDEGQNLGLAWRQL
ncbi:hypothetical protein D3C87_1715150 [compost metagenome]